MLRYYTRDDRKAFEGLVAAHPGLAHMDPDHPTNPRTLLLFDDDKLTAAMTAHATAEAFLVVNQQAGGPREKWGWIQTLIEAGLRECVEMGYGDIRISTPKQMEKYFNRLMALRGMHPDNDRFHGILNLAERYSDVG